MTNNDTWAILASGPSMSKEVAESVRPFRVIAVSNTYELAPWADVLVSNDKSWWTNTPDAKNFMGEKFCGLAIEPPRDVERFTGAMSGSNSALLAMQIAVSKGAKRILLFGVDLTGKHYFGDHPAPLRNPSAQRFEIFKKQFAAYQPKGVEIFNCSKSSQLRAYPSASVEDFLPREVVSERIESPLILQGQKGEKGDPGKAIEGPRGPQGPKGEPGPVGPMPEHEWQGTALRFEKPDGSWGEAINLKGDPGQAGQNVAGGGSAIRDSIISERSTWSSAKIAEQIEEAGGSGADEVFSLNVERPMMRKLHQAFLAGYSANVFPYRAVMLGDSLANTKPRYILREIKGRINAQFEGVPTSGPLTDAYNTTYYFDTVSGSQTQDTASGFEYWPSGPLGLLTSGDRWVTRAGGADPEFQKMKVYYVREPSAGSFQVLVNDAVVSTIDASNAETHLGVYEVSRTRERAKVEINGVTGTVRIIGATDTSTDKTDVYAMAVANGGVNLDDGMSSAKSRLLFTEFLADYNPSLFTLEYDELLAPGPLAQLAACLDSAVPVSDKLFIASTPQAGIPTSSARRDTLFEFVKSKNNTYFFFDGWAPLAPYQTLVDLGWEGDGIHASVEAQSYLSSLLMKQLGVYDNTFGFEAHPINNGRNDASKLGNNTVIQGNWNTGLRLKTDGTGFDGEIYAPRSIGFYGDLSGTDRNFMGLQLSQQRGVIPCVMPLGNDGFRWESATANFGLKNENWHGRNEVMLWDNDEPTGRGNMFLQRVRFESMTKAVALDEATGLMNNCIFVVQGAAADGGDCLCYKNGGGIRRVSDDAVVTL